MFEIGEIVRIDGSLWEPLPLEGSMIWNIDGSLVKIKKYTRDSSNDMYYKFDPVQMSIKDEDSYTGDEGNLWWFEKSFSPVNPFKEITENEFLSVINE